MTKRIFWLMVSIGIIWSGSLAQAQGPATPIPVNPPTATATPPPPTELPTRTPTSLGPASARALTEGTNVRAQPDISAERVGQIFPAQSYMIIGKYFEWYQIQFPETPNGIGWVHQSVVEVIGDANLIPDLSLSGGVPTQAPVQPTSDGSTAAEGFSSNPNPGATVENSVGSGPIIGSPIGGENAPQVNQPANILPTFTFPMITATPLNLGEIGTQQTITIGDSGLAPIIPILGLLGLGLLGTLITFLRR